MNVKLLMIDWIPRTSRGTTSNASCESMPKQPSCRGATSKSTLQTLLQCSVLACLMSISPATFAAQDSSDSFIPTTNPRDQYLLVDSKNPVANSASTTGSNSTITCKDGEQLIGLSEANNGSDYNPGNQAYARSTDRAGNYSFIPHCSDANYLTGSCTRDWVREYTRIDTIRLVCAKNSYKWENLNEFPNPDTRRQVIGSYTPPPATSP